MAKLVLIAEDEPRNMKLVRDLLHMSGYATVEAVNGAQAVEFARARRPDLILMDIHMPVMDGLQATRAIKADPVTKDTPVLALTASVGSGDRDQVFKAGCDGFVSKPIDVKEFLKIVSQYTSQDERKTDGRA